MIMTEHTIRIGTSRRRTPAPNLYELPTRERRDDGAIILHVGDLAPVCSDCGRGHLQWAEAGYVPWHRICDTCGSHWDLHPLGMGIAFVPQLETSTCRRDERIERRCPDCDGPSQTDWCDTCEATGYISRPHPDRTCYCADPHRCAERAAGLDEAAAAGLHDRLPCACVCHVPPARRPIVGATPSVWIDGRGWVPIDPRWPVTRPLREQGLDVAASPHARDDDEETVQGRTWGDLVALVTAAHMERASDDQDRTLGVPCVPACWARRARFYER